MDVASLKKSELVTELKTRRLSTVGNKAELGRRLSEFLSNSGLMAVSTASPFQLGDVRDIAKDSPDDLPATKKKAKKRSRRRTTNAKHEEPIVEAQEVEMADETTEEQPAKKEKPKKKTKKSTEVLPEVIVEEEEVTPPPSPERKRKGRSGSQKSSTKRRSAVRRISSALAEVLNNEENEDEGNRTFTLEDDDEVEEEMETAPASAPALDASIMISEDGDVTGNPLLSEDEEPTSPRPVGRRESATERRSQRGEVTPKTPAPVARLRLDGETPKSNASTGRATTKTPKTPAPVARLRLDTPKSNASTGRAKTKTPSSIGRVSAGRVAKPVTGGAAANKSSKLPTAAGGRMAPGSRFAAAHAKLAAQEENIVDYAARKEARAAQLTQANSGSVFQRLATPVDASAKRQPLRPTSASRAATTPSASKMTFQFGNVAPENIASVQKKYDPATAAAIAPRVKQSAPKLDAKQISKVATKTKIPLHLAGTSGKRLPLTVPEETSFINRMATPKHAAGAAAKTVSSSKRAGSGYTPHRGKISFVDTSKLTDKEMEYAKAQGLLKKGANFNVVLAQARRAEDRQTILAIKRKLAIK